MIDYKSICCKNNPPSYTQFFKFFSDLFYIFTRQNYFSPNFTHRKYCEEFIGLDLRAAIEK